MDSEGVTPLLSPSPYFPADQWIFYTTYDDVNVFSSSVFLSCVFPTLFSLIYKYALVLSEDYSIGSEHFFIHEGNAKKENNGYVVPKISTNQLGTSAVGGGGVTPPTPTPRLLDICFLFLHAFN